MRRLTLLVAPAAIIGVAFAACGDDSPTKDEVAVDETITIDAKNTKFVPDSITVPSGMTVKLILANQDKGTEHDLASDDLMVSTVSGGGHGGGAGDMTKFAVHTKEGESSSIIFKADTPGTYAIYCTVKGHKEAGMVGTITVT